MTNERRQNECPHDWRDGPTMDIEPPIESEDSRHVWVCESGDYEQRDIFLVAETVEAGIAAVKRVYAKPYIVTWDEPERDEYGGEASWSLVGHFKGVRGYSVEHTVRFDFERHEVES